ncbi:MAG TPA: sigma-54 dependent transcriptional regulator [Kofleriaceae bacterium]
MAVADPAMMRAYQLIARLARSDLSVLISGETGVGKEHVAHALHQGSRRAPNKLVALNCAALPDALVESELFGYERGAFSGAAMAKPGLLEEADGGTLFLDEVGELSLAAQAKLLRALERRRISRLGGLRDIAVDVRLVAATNRKLEDEVCAGRFRHDLLYRLNAATVSIPPLRARPSEIPLLAQLFLDRARVDWPPLAISTATHGRLARHGWPGNVRELKNVMEFVAVTVDRGTIEPFHLPPPLGDATGELPAPEPARSFRPVAEELRELERRRMVEALAAARGVQKRAATLIAMPLRTFAMKAKQYGLIARLS